MASIALVPGSFDPVTLGHLDIIERAARHFDTLIVAVIRNPQKTGSLFTLEERQELLAECLAHVPNIRIEFFKGLLVEFAKDHGAQAIVKGLRAVSDYEYEMQMAQTNEAVTGVRTVFLPAVSAHAFVSSTFIREIARYGGDVTALVPPPVARRLEERYQR